MDVRDRQFYLNWLKDQLKIPVSVYERLVKNCFLSVDWMVSVNVSGYQS